jgi:hypothetical protein
LGAQAVSSENAAVTTARQVQLVADLVGKLIVLPYANPENFVSGANSCIYADAYIRNPYQPKKVRRPELKFYYRGENLC